MTTRSDSAQVAGRQCSTLIASCIRSISAAGVGSSSSCTWSATRTAPPSASRSGRPTSACDGLAHVVQGLEDRHQGDLVAGDLAEQVRASAALPSTSTCTRIGDARPRRAFCRAISTDSASRSIATTRGGREALSRDRWSTSPRRSRRRRSPRRGRGVAAMSGSCSTQPRTSLTYAGLVEVGDAEAAARRRTRCTRPLSGGVRVGHRGQRCATPSSIGAVPIRYARLSGSSRAATWPDGSTNLRLRASARRCRRRRRKPAAACWSSHSSA